MTEYDAKFDIGQLIVVMAVHVNRLASYVKCSSYK